MSNNANTGRILFIKLDVSRTFKKIGDYNPGQNSFGHLCTKERDRHNSQDCLKNRQPPLQSPLVQCWQGKIKKNWVWCK